MAEKNMEEMFINRELSWLAFNRRVLDLAKDKAVPLGEQLKFAGIYGSNLDEFFMVRVGSLYDRTLLKETAKENKTGMTPAQQIDAIMPAVRELQAHCDKIVAKLYDNIAQHGLQKVNFEKLSKKQEHFWKRYFLREIFPVLSPQIIDRRHPFPFLRGGESYVGAMLHEKEGTAALFGLVPLTSQFQEVVFIPGEKGGVEFAPHIKAIAQASIPVVAHLGLTPQSVNAFGGFKVQGKDIEAAQKLIEDAKAVEEAGACMVVLECVPAKLAKKITEMLKVPTIGIGAGADCDGQVLVYQDLLAMYGDFRPKFVKVFANVGDAMREGMAAYIKETKEGTFPSAEHCFKIDDSVIEKLY